MTEETAAAVLLDHGVTREYRGFLPLVELMTAAASGRGMDGRTVGEVAQRHGFSVRGLLGSIRIIAVHIERSGPPDRPRFGGESYSLARFVDSLVREAEGSAAE